MISQFNGHELPFISFLSESSVVTFIGWNAEKGIKNVRIVQVSVNSKGLEFQAEHICVLVFIHWIDEAERLNTTRLIFRNKAVALISAES